MSKETIQFSSLSGFQDDLRTAAEGVSNFLEEAGLRSPERSLSDASDAYAAGGDYYIYFIDIPSGILLKFKAFLTAFEDQYDSQWRDHDTFGRMDPITTFHGTKRQINFSFDVVAGSAEEAISNFDKSRTLLTFLYPKYEYGAETSATAMSAPPMKKIRFANLIADESGAAKDQYLVGKLGGLSHRPNMDMGFYEGRGELYPKVNSFTCNFSIFHTQKLGFRTTYTPPVAEGTEEADVSKGTNSEEPTTTLNQQEIQSVGTAAAGILKGK
jgi:hypothetical protein